MALQNRVDPFGGIRSDASRGMFTGNRGIIHDPDTRTLLRRGWTTKAWIICALEHPRGKRRLAMGRNGPNGGAGWTELFFLDEVTALAAGHRPCFYCRRDAAKAFVAAWRTAPDNASASLSELDRRLHVERRATGGERPGIDAGMLADLPSGTMIASGDKAFALCGRKLLPWSFAGYKLPVEADSLAVEEMRLVTPPSTVVALRAGYRPAWHPSSRS